MVANKPNLTISLSNLNVNYHANESNLPMSSPIAVLIKTCCNCYFSLNHIIHILLTKIFKCWFI